MAIQTKTGLESLYSDSNWDTTPSARVRTVAAVRGEKETMHQTPLTGAANSQKRKEVATVFRYSLRVSVRKLLCPCSSTVRAADS